MYEAIAVAVSGHAAGVVTVEEHLFASETREAHHDVGFKPLLKQPERAIAVASSDKIGACFARRTRVVAGSRLLRCCVPSRIPAVRPSLNSY